MNKKELLERAQELNIAVPEGATNPEITNLIKIEEHGLLLSENSKLEETLEATQKVNEALENEKKEATDQVADLTQKLSDAEAERDEFKVALDAKSEELEAAKADQTKLKVEPKAKSGNEELPTYEHDGETYQFTVRRLVVSGGKITAEEAVEDKELMKSLIKSNFFGLKKV